MESLWFAAKKKILKINKFFYEISIFLNGSGLFFYALRFAPSVFMSPFPHDRDPVRAISYVDFVDDSLLDEV